jgi:hypothetical protein
VRECECRQVPVSRGKSLEDVDYADELGLNQMQALAHQDNVCVVADVAARCAEVYDGSGEWVLFAVGVNVRQHIVAEFLLKGPCLSVVYVGDVSLELGDLWVGDWEVEFLFALGKYTHSLHQVENFLLGETRNSISLLA